MILFLSTGQSLFKPQLSPDLQGKITSNTVILKEPFCVFEGPCVGCEIWLVAALTSGKISLQIKVRVQSFN